MGGLLAIMALVLVAERAWAIYYSLGPSKDEWGLKYEVAVEDAGADMVTVKLTLLDEGRLKPIHSVSLSVLDKQNSTPNSQRYTVVGRLEFKTTADGTRVGEIRLRKDQVDLANLQVLTQRVDGKFQARGAAYYDIPLAKHLNESGSPAVASPLPPASGKVKK
ncbi:MAG: hypothetical protein DWQ37_15130 [Planctomycetota bacterium]|nr:MAG: hypothetical protein DWQ37_15130 [Planctomycetota bacterium]